jgi:protein phosphatase
MKTFGVSDTGKVRQLNEDSYFLSDESVGMLPNLYIIADGMGGHNAGEVASALSIEKFVEFCRAENKMGIDLDEKFINGVEFANNEIYKLSVGNKSFRGMGTTFVACSIIEDIIFIANVGDSRCYILDAMDQTLKQITIDHSYVEELIQAGEITRAESLIHPDRNIITRALGTSEGISVDIFKLKRENASKILLCSDGLSNMIHDDQINDILLEENDLETQGNRLIKIALENGGMDNVTLVLIDTKLEGGWNNV